MAFNANEVERGSSNLSMPIITSSVVARLIGITDMGVQPQDGFGEKRPPRRELNLTFECTNKFMIDSEGNEVSDKPCWLYDTIKLHHPSADLAKSTLYAKALDPKNTVGYDFLQMLGMPIILNVGKNQAGKENKILGRSAMIEGMPCPDLINETFYFDLGEADTEGKFDNLPDWLKEKIQSSIGFNRTIFASTYNPSNGAGGDGNYGEDDDLGY